MGTNYWDYWRVGNYSNNTTDTSACYDTSISTGTSWSSSNLYYEYKTRKILVSAPDKWTDKQNMEFVELVNIKTKTGWYVTLVIKGGDIIITDPNIEKRSMVDFIPLLLCRTNHEETDLINKFLIDNPC